MLKFFRIPFATSGDKASVPDAVDGAGSVSYTEGYGFDYQRQVSDPLTKDVERNKMNQLFFDLTTAVGEIQQFGVPDFISAALNGGTAFPYAKNARVKYTDGGVYLSLIDANTSTPADTTKWTFVPSPFRTQKASNNSCVAGGTADALTGTFSPVIPYLTTAPETLYVMVRAIAANATTAPTFKADATAAKAIVKGNNQALLAGDISGAGHWLCLHYDATLDVWVLDNPAYGVSAVTSTSDPTYADNSSKPASTSWVRAAMGAIATAAGFSINLAANGYCKFPNWLGGWIIQWASGSASYASGTLNTFPVTFPTICLVVVATDNCNTSGANVAPQGIDYPNMTTSQFRAFTTSDSTGPVFRYIAIGY
jgi:hypothetical protein